MQWLKLALAMVCAGALAVSCSVFRSDRADEKPKQERTLQKGEQASRVQKSEGRRKPSTRTAEDAVEPAEVGEPGDDDDVDDGAEDDESGAKHPQMEMANVRYYVTPRITMFAPYLRGALIANEGYHMPVMDVPRSFNIRIDHGVVEMAPDDFARLLNSYVLTDDSPITDVSLSIVGDQLKMEGTLHKVIPVAFEMVADIAVTDDGNLRVHPVEIDAAGLPVENLLDLVGLEMEELINLRRVKGLWMDGDYLYLDPESIIPPPRIRGKVVDVRVLDDALELTFGGPRDEADRLTLPVDVDNYLFIQGRNVRFGKLIMLKTDLMLTDEDPGDPMGFNIYRYNRHLVHGVAKVRRDHGLVTYVPDWEDIGDEDDDDDDEGDVIP